MLTGTRRGLALLAAAVLTGCATLDESECRNADWRIIGMEDGAAGRGLAHVGEHRSACAEYGIRPDLAGYRQGHAEGLRQYCTPASGYTVGRRGKDYAGVCPPHLEDGFLAAYDLGLRTHEVAETVDRLGTAIRRNRRDVKALEEEVADLEGRLVEGNGSRARRTELLEGIKSRQAEIGALRRDTLELERERAGARAELEHLRSLHAYP